MRSFPAQILLALGFVAFCVTASSIIVGYTIIG